MSERLPYQWRVLSISIWKVAWDGTCSSGQLPLAAPRILSTTLYVQMVRRLTYRLSELLFIHLKELPFFFLIKMMKAKLDMYV